jgi:hypothetical protein
VFSDDEELQNEEKFDEFAQYFAKDYNVIFFI